MFYSPPRAGALGNNNAASPLQSEKLQSARARFTSLQQTGPSATVFGLYGRKIDKYGVFNGT
jgi:hypothetical protein